MLNDAGFDLWAKSYDISVGQCEDAGQYPFAGYKNVLDSIYRRVSESSSGRASGSDSGKASESDSGKASGSGFGKASGSDSGKASGSNSVSILDIGFGTGILTERLYKDGFIISGIDFSNQMIETARSKMPGAALFCHDFSHGLPRELDRTAFDFIISTYAMHHLTDAKKAVFIMDLQKHLKKDGEILIGDIAFETREQLNACKAECGDAWDEEEIYIVFDEIAEELTAVHAEFIPVSFCSGIISIRN